MGMSHSQALRSWTLLLALACLTACGGNVADVAGRLSPAVTTPPPAGGSTTTPPSSGGSTTTPPPSGGSTGGGSTPTSAVQPIQHVVVVVEENHSYESVIGSSEMPYLNSLANRYALATSYYADTHPSIGNYFMLTTGAVITNDDAFTGTVTNDNLARVFRATGKSWNVFAESLPSAGYLGGDTGAYVKHHNPFAYFSDVINDISQAQLIVPFSQFSSAVANNALPNFALVIPNNNDNGHNGTLAAADAWLKANIDPLVSDSSFQQNGLLLIVFDEGFDYDLQHGGGRVAAVLVGGHVKQGYRATTFFQHENALHLILEVLQVAHMPGAANGAISMNEMLNQ